MIIDQLPLLGGDVHGTDEFPIERGTTTYKTTQAALIKPATDAAAAAQAAADDAQLAADNAQDTADEANEKGLPPGGTAGQVLTKADSSDYSASWEDPSGGGDVTADMLGIVIDGNSTPVGASVGQYVIVKNSTISGITDGLYTAAQAIPANTAIDATYLSAVSGGGLNAVASVARWQLLWTNPSPNSAFSAQTISLDLTNYSEIKVEAYGYATSGYFGNIAFAFKGTHRNAILGYFNISTVGTIGLASRDFICEDTGIEFFEGYSKAVDVSTAGTVENLRCVPIRIYAR